MILLYLKYVGMVVGVFLALGLVYFLLVAVTEEDQDG